MSIDNTLQLLEELQSNCRENEWVEFKLNNSDPQEIGRNISALSNSACYWGKSFAYLVYGINDVTFEFIGTEFRPKTHKVKNQELENWLATLLNPRIDFTINEVTREDKHFVIFKISAALNIPVSFRGDTFIRIGSYTKNLDQHPERERKIWQASNWAFEKGLAMGGLSQSNVLELLHVPKYFDMLSLPLPSNSDFIIEKFIQDKLIVPFEGGFSITNLGALCFARRLEKFEQLGRKAMRVIKYRGSNRTVTDHEQEGKVGYAAGFEGLIKYINDQLPNTEVIEGALRKTKYTYPPLAIRELVANAIIHQDFNVSGVSSMVEIFQDRIEITNPGSPLIDPLRFVDHSPHSRNEMLARYLRRFKICEERGSGIDKVVFECEFYQLPAPNFIVGENYTRTILYGPKTLNKMDKQDKLRACYQHACLKYVSGEFMSNQSLRDRFGVESHNYSTVSRIIAETKDANLIKDYDPSNRSKTYAKYLPFWG